MIITNKIQCEVCKEIIESVNRHDYITCSCGLVSVDGGKDYLKRSWKIGATYIELSETNDV